MLNKSNSSGFSLVELMVAVVIGLIGTVVIFQVYAVSEGQKRTTISGGDSQQNGAIALFTIERDLRNAGHGLAELIARGQPVYGWNNDTAAARPAIIFRPAQITRGATSDSVEVNYTTFEGITSPVSITSPVGWNPSVVSALNQLFVASDTGFQAGNKIVVCPPYVTPPGAATDTCIVAEVTGTGPNNEVLLAPPPATFAVDGGALQTTKFNPAAGFSLLNARLATDGKSLPAAYLPGVQAVQDAVVYNLGDTWISRIYAVNTANGTMTVNDGTGPVEFADGIINIRAQYGIDTTPVPDGVVDEWVDPRSVPGDPYADNTPNHAIFSIASRATIAAGWARVQAIRIAVVTRSGLFEKEIVANSGTTTLWTNPAGNPTAAPTYSVVVGDAQHYRYKVFETIVPLRNMTWTPHRTLP